jgi:hypothetical protein
MRRAAVVLLALCGVATEALQVGAPKLASTAASGADHDVVIRKQLKIPIVLEGVTEEVPSSPSPPHLHPRGSSIDRHAAVCPTRSLLMRVTLRGAQQSTSCVSTIWRSLVWHYPQPCLPLVRSQELPETCMPSLFNPSPQRAQSWYATLLSDQLLSMLQQSIALRARWPCTDGDLRDTE